MKEENREEIKKEFLKWLLDTSDFSDNTIWSISDSFDDRDSEIAMEEVFGKDGAKILMQFVKKMVEGLTYHTDEEERPHEKTLIPEISKLQGQFRNHRHDNTKQYSGKAEY